LQVATVTAQETVVLSFGAFTKLDSVRVENLNNGSSELLKNNFSLELQLQWPTGTETIETGHEPLFYPNPFSQQVNFELFSSYGRKMEIAVYDMAGRVVAQRSQAVETGSNKFIFKPGTPGVYLIKASHNSIVYSGKVVCLEASGNLATIAYQGSAHSNFEKQALKSGYSNPLNDLTAIKGDILRFTGYSGTSINSIYDFVDTGKNYIFQFESRYIKFQEHLIHERIPGFMDVYFSVTDSANKGIDYLGIHDFRVYEGNELVDTEGTYMLLMGKTKMPTKTNTVLLVDNSERVTKDLEEIKRAVKNFVLSIREDQEMAILTFSDTILLLQDFTDFNYLLEYKVGKMEIGSAAANLYGSGLDALSKSAGTYTPHGVTQGSLVIITGGGDSESAVSLNDFKNRANYENVYVVGLNDPQNEIYGEMASPGRFYPIKDISGLGKVLTDIQMDIVQSSNSFYRLNYMSQKREGIHELLLTAANNTNSGANASISGLFDANGFQSVQPGVYLNPTDSLVYGLDTIRCFASFSGYKFAYDEAGKNIYGGAVLNLLPVSYAANIKPSYSWALSRNGVVSIETDNFIGAVLVPVTTASDTVMITLNDDANDLQKQVVFIMYPREFPDNNEHVLAQITDYRLNEISGIAASAKNPGHYWVHNDSGDDARIFLINTAGNIVATVEIASITSRDWEDIAVGPGPVEGESYVYIADIGDNNKNKVHKYIYRLAEPLIDTTVLKQSLRFQRNEVSAFTFLYADGPRDAEILMIEPFTKDLFVVTKRESKVQIYTLPFPQMDGDTTVLTKSAVPLPFRMTNAGDISADGTEILIKNLTTVYYWKRSGDETVIEALARKAIELPYIEEPQGEAIAWRRDGKGYLTVSESRDGATLLYFYKR
jgi:hypothetical protein